MNLVHLHLLLNHWPIIGSFIALGLFLVAVLSKRNDLREASLALFALNALLAIPAYLTGNLAQIVLQGKSDISETLVTTHQGAALVALIAVLIAGGFAWVGLWQIRQAARPAGWAVAAVLVSSIITVGLMTVAGNTGGAIRHPEILSGEPATSTIGALGVRLNAALQYAVTGRSMWGWPLLETFHYIGLALLFGATGVLNLRMLGFFRRYPAAPFHSFIPWGVAGLAINVMTGMLFFIDMPDFYVFNLDFHFKIVAIVLAGANLLLQSTTLLRDYENLSAGQDPPPFVKFLAASSLFLWAAAIVLGRYMPFYENSLNPPF